MDERIPYELRRLGMKRPVYPRSFNGMAIANQRCEKS